MNVEIKRTIKLLIRNNKLLIKVIRKMRTFYYIVIGREIFIKKTLRCKKETLGSSYGNYTICPDNLSEKSVVYSFGLGEDISFDLAIMEQYQCKVWGYDPTPKSIEWLKSQKLPDLFTFYPYALADYDGELRLFFPTNTEHVSMLLYNGGGGGKSSVFECHKLKTIMIGNNHQYIDILKMDIEGSEFKVVENILKEKIAFEQLVLEIHHQKDLTYQESNQQIKDLMRLLTENGYGIFFVSDDHTGVSFKKGKYEKNNIKI